MKKTTSFYDQEIENLTKALSSMIEPILIGDPEPDVQKALSWALRNLAIAGGVHLALLPEVFISMCRWGMLAPDARCKAFAAMSPIDINRRMSSAAMAAWRPAHSTPMI